MATQVKLLGNNTSEFGQAVAVSADYAIVGARQPSATSFSSPGEAHIYFKTGIGWSEQNKVIPVSPPGLADDFGTAVAIDGDYAIVGAPGHQPNSEGRAYVYHRNGSTWSKQQILAPSNPVPFGSFGSSVGLGGDSAIVGSDQGAYVFHRVGTSWTEQTKLGSTALQVSLSGQTAIINGPQGTVLVFQWNGTIWQQQAVLAASDAIPSNFFGGSLCVSGDHIIVGALLAQQVGTNSSGAAYVFTRTGSVWVQEAKLQAVTGPQLGSNQFAASVAISGDYAIVGDPSDGDIAPGAGAAYVYRRKGSAWPLVEKITASDAAIFDWFGGSVAIYGLNSAEAIVGAKGKESGAAYVLSDFPEKFDGLIDVSKYAIYAKILFGLTGGGSGVIWLPGVGPVPVDPEPFRVFSALSPIKRDVLLGLAFSEMANLVHDGVSREEVQRAGLKMLKRAADQIHVPEKIGAK
jgi:hypothetical protein